jgi:uncharacterized protein (DUF2141 family)
MAETRTANLLVKLSGFPNSCGIVRISLYNSPKGFPDNPRRAFRTGTAVIDDNQAAITLSDVPFGTYAISAYHDENENHRLDKSFFGIPQESVGASEYSAPIYGKPVYTKAAFIVEKPMCDIPIILFSPHRTPVAK